MTKPTKPKRVLTRAEAFSLFADLIADLSKSIKQDREVAIRKATQPPLKFATEANTDER